MPAGRGFECIGLAPAQRLQCWTAELLGPKPKKNSQASAAPTCKCQKAQEIWTSNCYILRTGRHMYCTSLSHNISSRPPPEHPSADQWETSLFLDMKESRALAWPVCSRLQVQLCTSPLVVISQAAPNPLGTYLPRTEHRRTPSSWRELGWSDVERSSNRYHQTIRMLNRIHHGGKQHFRQSKQQRSLVIFCPSFPFHQTIAICKGHLFHLFETGTNLKKTVVLNGSPKTGLDSHVRYSKNNALVK